jgi:O-antigen/teichoic acid export membrane protein
MHLKKNVAANFVGQGWTVLMNFAFIPVYIHYLGIEAYGLVGFFIALQAWIVIVDLGLSTTLSREMARSVELRDGMAGPRRLLRSVEKVYIVVGCCATAILVLGASYGAEHWFKASSLPGPVVETGIAVLGVGLVMRWAAQAYRSALQGLQDQVWLAAFSAAAATVRFLGAALLLKYAALSITGFFVWNAVLSLVELVVVAGRLYGRMPAVIATPAMADPEATSALRRVWRFAGAVFLTNLFAVAMTQSDKVLLSTLLSLADFGYYTFAFAAGTATAAFTTPIFQAVAPRLSADIASGDAPRLISTYHKACQTMTLVVVPAAAVGIFFSRRIIDVWANDAVLSAHAAPLAAIFIAAYMLNSLIHIPSALALGYGWARWAMVTNGLCALFLIPALLLATRYFGALGAACTNLALNLIYYVIAVRVLHRRYLRDEWRSWFIADTLAPLLLALCTCAALRLAWPDDGARWFQALSLLSSWVLTSLVVAMSMAYPRELLSGALRVARLR